MSEWCPQSVAGSWLTTWVSTEDCGPYHTQCLTDQDMGLNPGGLHLRKLGLIQEALPWVLMDMEVLAMLAVSCQP